MDRLPMDRNYIDTHHIVERYLADQLPAAQKAAFETYYLEHPEILDEMETVAALKVGFAALPAPSATASQPRLARFIPAALAAVLLAAVAAWWFSRVPLEAPAPSLLATSLEQLRATLPTGKSVRVEHRRGTGADAEIELPAQPQALRLRVQPDATIAASRVRLTLLRIEPGTGTQAVASLADLTPDAEGLVVAFVDSSALRAGSYELRLENAADSASEADRFNLVINPP